MSANKVDTIIAGICLYVMAGFIVMICMFGSDAPEVAEGLAVMLLWPLFAIKYTAIGIFLVLEAGLELLF